MTESLAAAELLDQLEQLSPAELEEEIADLKERTARAERLLKIIKGNDKAPHRRSAASGTTAETDQSIDKSLAPRERVAAFLAANGPTCFRPLMSAVGVMPAVLKKLLEGDRAFIYDDDDRTWGLKAA